MLVQSNLILVLSAVKTSPPPSRHQHGQFQIQMAISREIGVATLL
jgi:hypothetical protein